MNTISMKLQADELILRSVNRYNVVRQQLVRTVVCTNKHNLIFWRKPSRKLNKHIQPFTLPPAKCNSQNNMLFSDSVPFFKAA